MSPKTPFPTPESPFHPLPLSNITIPRTPLTEASHAFLLQHNSHITINHCLRSVCFALLLAQRMPNFASLTSPLDLEAVTISIMLHDMGWATSKDILDTTVRFEVDGANIARTFLTNHTHKHPHPPSSPGHNPLDARRLQLIWDAIALHTTPSIAAHKEPEVAAAQFGIAADFSGPYFPPSESGELGGLISVDEYKEIVRAFPRDGGYRQEFVEIMCGLCRERPDTTYDNFVSEFGREFGTDGRGGGREGFRGEWERKGPVLPLLMAGLGRLVALDEEVVKGV